MDVREIQAICTILLFAFAIFGFAIDARITAKTQKAEQEQDIKIAVLQTQLLITREEVAHADAWAHNAVHGIRNEFTPTSLLVGVLVNRCDRIEKDLVELKHAK